MSESINWADVPDEGPAPAPPGLYGYQVVKAEPRTTKKGERSINLELKLTHRDGESPGSCEYKSFKTCMLQGRGMFMTKQLALAVGVDLPASLDDSDVDNFCESLLGREGYAVFSQEKYKKPGSTIERTKLEVERFVAEGSLEEARQATAAE